MSLDGTIIFRKADGQRPLKTAAIGCGGMGCNSLRSVELPKGMRTIALGFDKRKMANTGADYEMVIDPKDAESSAHSKESRYAANDSEMQLSYLLKDYDMVFPIAGLGGNTGGWLASLVCRSAKLAKATPLALVTTPLSVEGTQRRHKSTKQLEALRHWGSAVIFKNDQILKEVPNLPIMKAFKVMNKVVTNPVGEFNDMDRSCMKQIKSLLRSSHIFRMDVAEWRGDDPVNRLNNELRESDWLSLNVLDPKSALFIIEGFGVNESWAKEFHERFSTLSDHGHEIPAVMFIDDRKIMKEVRVTALIGL